MRTDFPNFQDLFTIIVEYDTPDAAPFEEKHCVGKFFDTGGYFWEAGFAETVQCHGRQVRIEKEAVIVVYLAFSAGSRLRRGERCVC